MKTLWPIHSYNFTLWNAAQVDWGDARRQIDDMVDKCGVNTVTFIVSAQQAHTYSTDIDWKGPHMPSDADLTDLMRYAADKGLRCILKPMLNPTDGYWRAHIRFFDEDVPCEPKWGDWFHNYQDYIVHYAVLCEREGIDMLIAGCELVGTDHRETEWRTLIAAVRAVYGGLVTYNCDKYQEHNVAWWDACDAISSSGYYPVTDWPQQIERIARVVEKFDKPFFFSEVGCPSTAHTGEIPNDWTRIGKNPYDAAEQAKFFHVMFEACEPLDWHFGYCIWDWPFNLRPDYDPKTEKGYAVIDKPAAALIRDCFSR